MSENSKDIKSTGMISEELQRRRRTRPRPMINFDSVAECWRDAAMGLAKWVQQHMLNRSDVHGSYLPLLARAESNDKAVTRYEEVTLDLLTRHFTGADLGHLIGLHTTTPDNLSRWMAIDIDSRSGNTTEATWSAAHLLFERLGHLGLRVLLSDSDGRGGFHLLVLFDSPIKTQRLYDFGRWMLRDTPLPFLPSVPEVFPKQAELKAGQVGNWLRLPGRHHTHNHWTRVWDGGRWLAGNEAIQHILEFVPNSESQMPKFQRVEEKDACPKDWALTQIADKFPRTHPINVVLSRLKGVIESGDQWAARCPAHNDHNPSLSISVGDRGKVLLSCHRGCDTEDVLEAIELTFEGLWAEESMVGRGKRRTKKTVEPDIDESLAASTVDWMKLSGQFEAALTEERLLALSETLKVSSQSLGDVCVGWHEQLQCYTFPECDSTFNVIGIMQRFVDGSKRSMAGSKRGLCIPVGFREMLGPILIVEGASDVAACLSVGLCAVGRPSAAGGGKLLIDLLKTDPREIVVVGEFDPKSDGTWPGKLGAERISSQIANDLGRETKMTFPPHKHKDVREWLACGMV